MRGLIWFVVAALVADAIAVVFPCCIFNTRWERRDGRRMGPSDCASLVAGRSSVYIRGTDCIGSRVVIYKIHACKQYINPTHKNNCVKYPMGLLQNVIYIFYDGRTLYCFYSSVNIIDNIIWNKPMSAADKIF